MACTHGRGSGRSCSFQRSIECSIERHVSRRRGRRAGRRPRSRARHLRTGMPLWGTCPVACPRHMAAAHEALACRRGLAVGAAALSARPGRCAAAQICTAGHCQRLGQARSADWALLVLLHSEASHTSMAHSEDHRPSLTWSSAHQARTQRDWLAAVSWRHLACSHAPHTAAWPPPPAGVSRSACRSSPSLAGPGTPARSLGVSTAQSVLHEGRAQLQSA